MNGKLSIATAIAAIALIFWMNAFEYKMDGAHGIYRINRLTHTVDYGSPRDGWERIDESHRFDLSTARQVAPVEQQNSSIK